MKKWINKQTIVFIIIGALLFSGIGVGVWVGINNGFDINQLLTSMIGTITGGLITLAITYFSLNTQFKRQKSLFNRDQLVKERRALLLLKNELFDNLSTIFYLIDKSSEADTEINSMYISQKPKITDWEQIKGDVLLIDDDTFVLNLCKTYFLLTAINKGEFSIGIDQLELLKVEIKQHMTKAEEWVAKINIELKS